MWIYREYSYLQPINRFLSAYIYVEYIHIINGTHMLINSNPMIYHNNTMQTTSNHTTHINSYRPINMYSETCL